jgi:hypothetical protein
MQIENVTSSLVQISSAVPRGWEDACCLDCYTSPGTERLLALWSELFQQSSKQLWRSHNRYLNHQHLVLTWSQGSNSSSSKSLPPSLLYRSESLS